MNELDDSMDHRFAVNEIIKRQFFRFIDIHIKSIETNQKLNEKMIKIENEKNCKRKQKI